MQDPDPFHYGMCLTGCGFNGSAKYNGLCTSCYIIKVSSRNDDSPRVRLQVNSKKKKDPLDLLLEKVRATLAEHNPKSSKSVGETTEVQPEKPKNRCQACRKKVGFTGIECRCGGLFCGAHRYSDTHGCSFDYKAMGAEEIRTNNPVVIAQKINKI